MPTRKVVVTEHPSRIIERLVASGRSQSVSEVLREGLRLLERQEELHTARLDAFREAVRVGIADIESGHYLEFEGRESLRSHLGSVADAIIAEGGPLPDGER